MECVGSILRAYLSGDVCHSPGWVEGRQSTPTTLVEGIGPLRFFDVAPLRSGLNRSYHSGRKPVHICNQDFRTDCNYEYYRFVDLPHGRKKTACAGNRGRACICRLSAMNHSASIAVTRSSEAVRKNRQTPGPDREPYARQFLPAFPFSSVQRSVKGSSTLPLSGRRAQIDSQTPRAPQQK